jgi:hypothetical protein
MSQPGMAGLSGVGASDCRVGTGSNVGSVDAVLLARRFDGGGCCVSSISPSFWRRRSIAPSWRSSRRTISSLGVPSRNSCSNRVSSSRDHRTKARPCCARARSTNDTRRGVGAVRSGPGLVVSLTAGSVLAIATTDGSVAPNVGSSDAGCSMSSTVTVLVEIGAGDGASSSASRAAAKMSK